MSLSKYANGQPFSNYFASASPGVSDDETAGYCVGSKWCDIVGLTVWECTDPSTGAAVWVQINAGTPAATSRGQILYSTDGLTFTPQTPLASVTGEIITEDDTGFIVVEG